MAGAEVFATASTGKQDYLRHLGITHIYDSRSTDFASRILADTHEAGVDVILNSLTSTGFIDASLSCLRQGGVFIEIGKRNIFTIDVMHTKRPDVIYHIISLDQRIKNEPKEIHQELTEIIQYFAQEQIKPLPVTEFAIQEIRKAMVYLQQAQHIGKVIVCSPPPFHYRQNATYLITGGTGGLGLSLAAHLIEQGVQHLVLTSRHPPAESLKKWMQEQGNIVIRHEAIDTTDKAGLAKLIATVEAGPYPLAGVFHASGILHDGLLINQTWENWESVLNVKILGATYLDELTRGIDLDCFVLFSSIASILGSPGQTNYAAANAFMDGLAQARRQEGLHALAINWGPFADVGMAAQLTQIHRSLGLTPLQTNAAWAQMDALLSTPYAQAGLFIADWQQQGTGHPYLSQLIPTNDIQNEGWYHLLVATPAAQQHQVLLTKLKALLAEVLQLSDAQALDANKNFFELGMDSLMAVTLKNKIQSTIGNQYPLNDAFMFENHNLQQVTDYLLTVLVPDQSASTEVNSQPEPLVATKSLITSTQQPNATERQESKDTFTVSPTTQIDLLSRLEEHAQKQPDHLACLFLQGANGAELTYKQLVAQAKSCAGALLQKGLTKGDRVLIILPQSTSALITFLGCLYAGGIAILSNPPLFAAQSKRTFLIIKDAQPTFIIANSAIIKLLHKYAEEVPDTHIKPTYLEQEQLHSIEAPYEFTPPQKTDIAFLQYTSGSTGNPKGVIIDHGNLLANLSYSSASEHVDIHSKVVSWLPLTHDMGLIGTSLSTLYVGAQLILMNPVEFISRPLLWLETITKYQATHTCAPNFAFALCAKEAKKLPSLSHLDLSSLIYTGTGSETIRPDTLDLFCDTFKSAHFDPYSIVPGYGMAEATLIITREQRGPLTLFKPQPNQNDFNQFNKNGLVSCGFCFSDEKVVIVNTTTRCEQKQGEIGEIWVQGPSVSRGYWNNLQETQNIFAAYLADGRGPFLRTGDLGLFNEKNQLFFIGRIKDVIIIHGKNYAPQDIEETVEQSSSLIAPNQVIAFSFEHEDEEKLVCIMELTEELALEPKEALIRSIKRNISLEHGIVLFDIRLGKIGSIPNTTSGKLQRQLCKQQYLSGHYEV